MAAIANLFKLFCRTLQKLEQKHFCFSFSIPQQQKSDGAARTARPTVQAEPQTLTPQNGITVGATAARFKQAKPRNGIPKS